MTRIKVFRPDLDDVERLSYGKGATKKRGTGSRQVCHRLNREERKQYELAKQASYLTLNGTGYRKNRKGSPLVNTFRQRCDALSELCIIIEKRADVDTVIIDFSTLRVPNDHYHINSILENVFKAKYKYLYDSIIGSCNYNGDPSEIISGKAIDLDSLRTNPIWAIDERLLTVSCDRDVAKALVIDIVKETLTFESNTPIDIAREESSADQQIEDELKPYETQEGHIPDDEQDVKSTHSSSSSSSDIDWNDI